MKSNRIIFSLAIALMMTSFMSCTQSKKTESEVSQLTTLKSDLKILHRQIDSLATLDSVSFVAEASEVIYEFNAEVDNFERQIKEAGQEIDDSTQLAINELKEQAKALESKLNTMGEEAYETMKDLQKEVKNDFHEFGESISGFFTDNA